MAPIASLFSGIASSRIVEVFVASVLPFVENKGAILLAASLKLKWYLAFLASSVGAYLPVPFLLKAKPKKLTAHARSASRMLPGSVAKPRAFIRKCLRKYGHWGIFLAVSVPFTGVGCWLSAIVANLAGINKRYSALAILLGTLVSSLITTLAVYGLISGVSYLFGL